MPHDIAIAYLVISRMSEPPSPPEIARAIAGAGLGMLEYAPADATSPPGSGGRKRIGTFTGTIMGTAAPVRLAVWHASEPVTTGMGEAALNALANGLAAEEARVLREGRLSFDLRATIPEAQTQPALDWMVQVALLVAERCDGVVMDPLAQRCDSTRRLIHVRPRDPLAHVAIHNEPWGVESRWLHTHGLQKFGRPELELIEVPLSLVDEADTLLRDITASLAGGAWLAAGDEINLDELGFIMAGNAPADVDHQAAFGRLRLSDSPLPGERGGSSHQRFLKRAALVEAARRRAVGDEEGALRDVDRVLAADPDECGALMLKALIFLSQGLFTDALELGELMELRVPSDYRGPLCVGMALAALERFREALHELDRAIEREPEAADAFAARAEVYERLGQEQRAALDRARVAYLAG